MPKSEADALDGAAIFKLAFVLQGKQDHPNFRVVYRGVLQDLGLTDAQVDRHIELHRERLRAVLVARGVIRDSAPV